MSLTALSPSEAHTLLKQYVGQRITLASDYMTQKAGSEWSIKSVNMLGGTCVVAVNPADGPGKGFFAPYKQFHINMDQAPPEPVISSPEPQPIAVDPLAPRNEFIIDGFDDGDPVYEFFVAVAPDTDSARELFMTYVTEHSEYDTEPLDDLMRSANVRKGAHWTDTNVTQMLMLLSEAQDPVDNDIESPEEAPGVDEPQQDAPPVTPAVYIHPDVRPLNGPDPAPPKRRGRPPGSKNKVDLGPEPDPQPAIRTVPAAVLTAALDNVPVVSEVREVLPVPQAGPIAVPSPVGIDLACRILPEIAADDNPEFLLEQVVGVIRRALLLDD